jgi:hypothetical protein
VLTSHAPEAANAGKAGAQHKAIAVAHDKGFLTAFRRSILLAPADYLFITQYRKGCEGEIEKIAGDAVPEVRAEDPSERNHTAPLSTKDSYGACILKKPSLVICGKSELSSQFTVFD